jgi:hypothetical protein
MFGSVFVEISLFDSLDYLCYDLFRTFKFLTTKSKPYVDALNFWFMDS